jgi:DNA-binding NarL/FixJ family response regulator
MLGASTIRSYRVKILRKLHVGSNAELIQYTIGQELLETPLVSK